jgi:hypothetical protein
MEIEQVSGLSLSLLFANGHGVWGSGPAYAKPT